MQSVPTLLQLSLCWLLLPVQSLAAETTWRVAQTEHGYPDLQGYWTNPTQTPLQRPSHLGDLRSYTPAQARALEQAARDLEAARKQPSDPNRPAPQAGQAIGPQADQNFELRPIDVANVNGEYRTSLIVDPPDGRLPLRPGFRDFYQRWRDLGFGPYDGPEIRPGQERCLNSAGQLPLLYTFEATNAIDGDNPVRNIQIVQTENYVLILSEYFSAVRIIRLAENHIDALGPRWLGDSIARYDGDHLVIHSTHFRPEQSNFFIRSSAALEITERYIPVGEDELLFRYTITDPAVYTQSVSAEIPLRRMADGQRLYEYACHEGNYSLPSILRAARMDELRRQAR